ncbi:MAG: DMT family transporter [Gemmatimonadaceae bacterium]
MPSPSASITGGTLRVALAACCFSTISIFIVLGTQRGGAPLATVLAGRYTLAALALTLVHRIERRRANAPGPTPPGRAIRAMLLGGTGQALIAYLALSALRIIPAATVGFLFYTFPAWVAIVAAVRGTEPLDARRVLAVALALGGVLVLVGSPWSARLNVTGVVMVLASAVIYALYIPLLRALHAGTSAAAVASYIATGSAIIYVVAGLITGTLTLALSPAAWGAVIGLALVSTTLGFVLFLRGLAVLGPVRAAIVCTVEPFATALLAALVLGQPVTWATGAGGAMVAGAVALAQLPARGAPRPPQRR